jgi:hypothetical protein
MVRQRWVAMASLFAALFVLSWIFMAYLVAERKPGIFPTAGLGLGQVFSCALTAVL